MSAGTSTCPVCHLPVSMKYQPCTQHLRTHTSRQILVGVWRMNPPLIIAVALSIVVSIALFVITLAVLW